jgi:hypothetical protein
MKYYSARLFILNVLHVLNMLVCNPHAWMRVE